MFKVELIGNLGADAEVKEANGSKFVAMRVALTDRWTSDDGQIHESTIWADVTMNNHESKVIPYLKQGVKVFVRGNGSLRVYSSPKEKRMLAGLKCAAQEIELCGGMPESVPRQVVNPADGTIYNTKKFYWCEAPTKGMKRTDVRELIDVKGNRYLMDNRGFVAPIPEDNTSESDNQQTTDTGNAK